ncbi:MAG: undecaprenyl-diphosphatase 1 [Micavibrio sp.]|nr:MAG: undecaprenyl-diphosphatase 1 [Micavibrio sp.]
MILYHIIILALIQGITEFLPVSSSGHLVLAHAAIQGDASGQWGQDQLLDVAVHVGTLLSVLIYFRRDVMVMLTGLKDWMIGDRKSEGAKLDLHIFISSLPVIAAGFILHEIQPDFIRSVEIVAWMTLIFGVALWHADRSAPTEKMLRDLTIKDAFLIGLAQCLALIPGTSRSGITMTAARYLGFSRDRAARYSLLLAIVAISGAGALGGIDLVSSGNMTLTFDVLLAAFLAFISGFIAIALMMKWLERATFTPFAIYRIILGIFLLGFVYGFIPGQ